MINEGKHKIEQVTDKVANSGARYFLALTERGNPTAISFSNPEEAERVARELLRLAVVWRERNAPMAAPTSMTWQRAAVLAVLQQAEQPLRLTEVAGALKVKPTNAAALLYRMRTDGQADYVVAGAYRRWHATPV